MKPKIEDVADSAGVSTTTVSRVLNNRGYISDKTREKVYQAMEKLNYFPNDIARSLFTNKTFLLGLIFPNTSNPFYGELIFHLENIASYYGYKALLCNSQSREDKEKEYLKMLQSNQVDGIISGAHNEGIEEYENISLPVVGIDRYLSDEIPTVSSDNYKGGEKATQLLIDKGCLNIIHINGPISLKTPANLRRKAYEDVMNEQGLYPIVYEVPNLYFNDQSEVIKRIFVENNNIDGIFASDDVIASLVISESKKWGIDIPKDMKVIGYDSTKITKTFLPDLTTIEQPIKEIAESAINLLLTQIENKEAKIPLRTVLPISINESNTTK